MKWEVHPSILFLIAITGDILAELSFISKYSFHNSNRHHN